MEIIGLGVKESSTVADVPGITESPEENTAGAPAEDKERTQDEIREQVQLAAYFNYLERQRGDVPGSALQDWLDAKLQILNEVGVGLDD
jgi:hypothetical protein